VPPPRLLTSTLKCLTLLEVIADQPGPARLSDLARQTGAGRATVHQQLSTLAHAGWVEQVDGGRYRLTLRPARLAYRALRQASLGMRVQPTLEKLAGTTGEAVSLAVLDDTEALIVQRVESGQKLRLDLDVGTRMPLDTSASGRVLAAFSEPDRIQRLRAANVPLPPDDTLETIREEGYAMAVDEYIEGIFAVAAPVTDPATGALMALSAAGPSSRFDPHAAVDSVLCTADEIRAVLGGQDRSDKAPHDPP